MYGAVCVYNLGSVFVGWVFVYTREHLTFLTLRRSSHNAFEETGNFLKLLTRLPISCHWPFHSR